MGSILRQEKIGVLGEGGGTITLQPSILNIGGKQFQTDALQVGLPAFSSPSDGLGLYFVFAVAIVGVASIVISQNVNSIGPAGFSSWRLVGAFMANDLTTVGFGAFINVEGIPRSGNILVDGRILEFGSTTPAERDGTLYRDGQSMIWEHNVSPGNGATGGNLPTIDVPGLLTYPGSSNNGVSVAGVIHTSTGIEKVLIANAGGGPVNILHFAEHGTNFLTALTNTNYGAFGQSFRGKFKLLINEWDETPLKDL